MEMARQSDEHTPEKGRTDEQPRYFEAGRIRTKEWCVGLGEQADKHKGMCFCFLFGTRS